MNFPLASSSPSALGFADEPLDRLTRTIETHIPEGRYRAHRSRSPVTGSSRW